MKRNRTALLIALTLGTLLLAACAGAPGPAGPAGAEGPAGPQGPAGEAAMASVGAEYVGAATCGACHADIYSTYILSGHPYKLNKVVDGQPPVYPYTEVPAPPEGYTWADVSYVIGGYGWKARFIGLDGFIITGADENAKNQYNLATGGWAGYHPGEKKAYDCGTCHTTGYNPEGHQDGLEGLVGTWAEPGITCEECHGPGSSHAANPYGVALVVDRSAQACGDCHIRGDVSKIDAKGGFIQHHEQAEELYSSKHMALTCVSCHDPHKSAVNADAELNPKQGIWNSCEGCHFNEAANQKSSIMGSMLSCSSCHMPPMVKTAVGNAATFTADIQSHIFAINTDGEAAQFTEDGKVAMPYLTIQYACGYCHVEGGTASVRDVASMADYAKGYHSR